MPHLNLLDKPPQFTNDSNIMYNTDDSRILTTVHSSHHFHQKPTYLSLDNPRSQSRRSTPEYYISSNNDTIKRIQDKLYANHDSKYVFDILN